MDDTYFIRNDHWKCGLEDEDDVHLGLVYQVYDMREIDDEMSEDEEYPYFVNAEIMVVPEEMSEKYREQVAETSGIEPDEVTIYDAVSYGGGVPAMSVLEGISSSRKSSVESKPVKEDRRGWTTSGRYFKTWEDAETYIKEIYNHHADALFGLIGFTLDNPVNLIGTTGWDMIKFQKEGVDWMR